MAFIRWSLGLSSVLMSRNYIHDLCILGIPVVVLCSKHFPCGPPVVTNTSLSCVYSAYSDFGRIQHCCLRAERFVEKPGWPRSLLVVLQDFWSVILCCISNSYCWVLLAGIFMPRLQLSGERSPCSAVSRDVRAPWPPWQGQHSFRVAVEMWRRICPFTR